MDCGFGDQLDNRLKDKFFIGLRSDHIKPKLFEDEDIDLAEILKKARAIELVDCERSSSKSASHSVAQHVRTSRPPQRQEVYKHLNARENGASSSNKFAQVPCERCGKRGHLPEKYYFLTQQLTCNRCGRVGHKATVCKSRPPSPSSQPQHKTSDTSRSASKNWRAKSSNKNCLPFRDRSSSHHVNETESLDSDASDSSNHVDDSASGFIITVHSIENVSPITYNVELNSLPITMELDSGSCYSLLNSEHCKQLGKPELTKGPKLRDVSRNSIPVLGIAYVDVRVKEQQKRLRVVFIDRPDTASLLGREWIAEFNLLTVQQAISKVSKYQVAQQTSPHLENLLEEFKDLFDNSYLPPIHGFMEHLQVKPDANYRLFKARSVPYSLRSKIETELERLKDWASFLK